MIYNIKVTCISRQAQQARASMRSTDRRENTTFAMKTMKEDQTRVVDQRTNKMCKSGMMVDNAHKIDIEQTLKHQLQQLSTLH